MTDLAVSLFATGSSYRVQIVETCHRLLQSNERVERTWVKKYRAEFLR